MVTTLAPICSMRYEFPPKRHSLGRLYDLARELGIETPQSGDLAGRRTERLARSLEVIDQRVEACPVHLGHKAEDQPGQLAIRDRRLGHAFTPWEWWIRFASWHLVPSVFLLKSGSARCLNGSMSTKAAVKHGTEVNAALAREYPEAVCALHHKSPFQLLVATILSAQCTDARVNLVTPGFLQTLATRTRPRGGRRHPD